MFELNCTEAENAHSIACSVSCQLLQKGKNLVLEQRANLKLISLAKNKFYTYDTLYKLYYSPNIFHFIAFPIHDSKAGITASDA